MEDLVYVDLAALKHLARGLTFNAERCAEMLDATLVELNRRDGFIDAMTAWVRAGGLPSGPGPYVGRKRLLFTVHESQNRDGQTLSAACAQESDEPQSAPAVILVMHSPTLDIPMRVEIPLRVLLQGGPPLENTYTVYLHALETDRGPDWVYYGITRRGWSLRFHEHTRAAVAQKSQRLLARTLNALVEARAAQLRGLPDGRPALAGIVTALCSVGLTHAQALSDEEYLVESYSLASKHPFGLNMIPGGAVGLAHAQRFRRRGPGTKGGA